MTNDKEQTEITARSAIKYLVDRGAVKKKAAEWICNNEISIEQPYIDAYVDGYDEGDKAGYLRALEEVEKRFADKWIDAPYTTIISYAEFITELKNLKSKGGA